jgi:hypothetical protein
MLLYFQDGRILPGILLSLRGNQMRVALIDADDIAEFRMYDGVWLSENSEAVTFEFPTAVFHAIGVVPEAHPNRLPQPDLFWQPKAAPCSFDRVN